MRRIPSQIYIGKKELLALKRKRDKKRVRGEERKKQRERWSEIKVEK